MTAHRPTGQWRKRHKGVDYYFGPLTDPDGALKRWREEWPRIVAGQPRYGRPAPEDGVKTGRLIDLFLASKLRDHERGTLEWSSYRDYQSVCKTIKASLGPDRQVSSLDPHDFDRLMQDASSLSISRQRKVVVHTRSIFKWALESGRIRQLPEYGPGLKAPPVKLERRAKREKGPRHLTPDQIKTLLRLTAGTPIGAMILLGLNGGYGNNDLAQLRKAALRERPGWIIQPRAKTEADRFVPLWPETLAALEPVQCPGKLLFAGHDGKPLVHRNTDQIAKMARGVFDAAGLTDRTFYDLRRTFATYAAEANDEHASRLIMGHVIDGVHAGYIQQFPRRRLYAVAFHVRARLGL